MLVEQAFYEPHTTLGPTIVHSFWFPVVTLLLLVVGLVLTLHTRWCAPHYVTIANITFEPLVLLHLRFGLTFPVTVAGWLLQFTTHYHVAYARCRLYTRCWRITACPHYGYITVVTLVRCVCRADVTPTHYPRYTLRLVRCRTPHICRFHATGYLAVALRFAILHARTLRLHALRAGYVTPFTLQLPLQLAVV